MPYIEPVIKHTQEQITLDFSSCCAQFKQLKEIQAGASKRLFQRIPAI